MEPRPRHTPQATVLLVDDRPANLLALDAVLEPLGQRLIKATSGEEALRHLLSDDVAVILMDVQMPNLDGIQTAALIQAREKSRHIPIIFLTAINKDPSHIFAGYEHGGVDYLVKPFDDDILRRKVWIFVQLYLKEKRIQEQERLLRESELEAARRRNEARFRTLIDAMPQCVWAASAEGEVYYFNRVWLAYTGHSGETTDRDGYLEAIHLDDRARVEHAWREAVLKETPFELEFRVRRGRDGSDRWHLGRGVPEKDERGAVNGWIATLTDIDDQRRLSEEHMELLERAEKARSIAEAANRSKDEFLATVSHELRNPLQAILGWVRILRSESLSPDALEKALETIERNATVQAQLIEDILDVSRIITGKMRIEVKPIRWHEIIQAAVDTVRPAIDGKGLSLKVELDPAADNAAGDPDRLQQVVWNLLSNAIKFTGAGGQIDLRLTRVGSQNELVVKDTGRGISPDFLSHVFDRFRQADSSSTRVQGGLGLGLAIVRHLVELHGGSVEVESAGINQGSKFTVTLPTRTMAVTTDDLDRISAEKPPRALLPFGDAPSLDGVRVLVVDDDRDARELLSTVLCRFGANVTAVSSVEEALLALDRSALDVLVSDIGMPREDGFSLIQKVRTLAKEARQIPAMALTGFARSEDGQKALAAGFQLHVPKPVDPAQLVVQVAALAGRACRRAT
jgi:PAS domain S-box-containing protein